MMSFSMTKFVSTVQFFTRTLAGVVQPDSLQGRIGWNVQDSPRLGGTELLSSGTQASGFTLSEVLQRNHEHPLGS